MENERIKFRAKTEDGIWKIGYYEERVSMVCGNAQPFIWCQKWQCLFKVVRETVGQFICRKDVNERDIYEGDIIEVNGKIKKVVQFVPEMGAFCAINIQEYRGTCERYFWEVMDKRWCKGDTIEVIGNVYDDSVEEMKGGTENGKSGQHQEICGAGAEGGGDLPC